MVDFGFFGGVGLVDIVEVELIRVVIFLWKDFFVFDDIDVKGGVMNCLKLLEGNNLFGGW